MAFETRLRRATPDDIAAIRAILRAHDEDSVPGAVDIVGPYVRHLVETAIALVAVRDGEVVGYGAAIEAGPARHLADLFIRPDLLGRGIGRMLLDAVLDGAERRTTFASADPRALPLYVRAGMQPLWPGIALEGRSGRLPPPPPQLRVESAEPYELSHFETAWVGADRRRDHLFWASQARAEAVVVLDRDEPIAFAYLRARQISDARAIDRLVVRPDAEPVAPILAVVRHAAAAGPAIVTIPGPNRALRPLLEAGFRIVERDQFLASDPDLVDPHRLIPNPGML